MKNKTLHDIKEIHLCIKLTEYILMYHLGPKLGMFNGYFVNTMALVVYELPYSDEAMMNDEKVQGGLIGAIIGVIHFS